MVSRSEMTLTGRYTAVDTSYSIQAIVAGRVRTPLKFDDESGGSVRWWGRVS